MLEWPAASVRIAAIMPLEMFTHDWAVAWGEEIRANREYREAARDWKWPMVFTMRAMPDLGLPERSVYLDLFEGDCREARTATSGDLESVPYVMSGDPTTWKRVVDQDLEPIGGLISGKLKLEKGSITSLLPYVKAARELVLSAARVDTRFPDGFA